jgi:DNA-binding response OmpR family regulator
MTILIIDDEDFVNKILAPSLREEGYDVDVALDGEEGLKKILTLKPDFVLLDILMPKMNGCEVLEKLNEQNLDHKPRIVILSAFVQTDQIKKALSLGAEDYWVKSDLDVQNIIDRINKKLKGK